MSNPNGDIDLTATMPCKESISALGFRPSQSYPTFLHAYGRALATLTLRPPEIFFISTLSQF